MSENPTNEILTVSSVWDGHAADGTVDGKEYGPWLLTFHLTDLGDGRLQCVGFEMRSYLRERPAGSAALATWADPSEAEPTPKVTDEAAAWVAERRAKGLPVPDLEVYGSAPSKRAQRLSDQIFMTDREAANVGADKVLTRPRELQAQMVGSFRFGSWLGIALKQAAREHAGRADFLREVLQDDEYFAPMPAKEAARLRRALNLVSQAADDVAVELNARGRRPGRPREHGPEELWKAAQYYTAFWRRGSRNPTALLQERLNIEYNVAAKLVQTCRRPEVGLLPPSTGRRAEAWDDGEAPWEIGRAAAPRDTDDRKGQR